MVQKEELLLLIPAATDIFKTFMPPISIPYPRAYIANGRNWKKVRTELLDLTGCKHTESSETSIMEYIHGDKGGAILIRQNLLPDDNDEHFCWMYWHELGHFYAINSENPALYHYNDPGLVDNSHLVTFVSGQPVLGLSDQRLKQEGYWFWQEFIAEAISKYVSFKHRSTTRSYHPELLTWEPQNWSAIVDKLMRLVEDSLVWYPSTIDEYSLAHYFANLLMDDFVLLYVRAAAEGKLKRYEGDVVVGTKPGEVEPTCISDMPDEFQPALWRMRDLLEGMMKRPDFWKISEGQLLSIGGCIGELMLEKVKMQASRF